MGAPSQLLSEDEARQEMCPFIRYTINEMAVLQGGVHPLVEHAPCRASACRMAWRWGAEPRVRFFVTAPDAPEEEWQWDPSALAHVGPAGTDYYKDYTVRKVTDPRKGYCGAAGKPGG